ncbi:MAG: capsid protein [Giant panda Genomoviridae]|nr:MAG: capsid protein [Giant panda Genomoviridae]
MYRRAKSSNLRGSSHYGRKKRGGSKRTSRSRRPASRTKKRTYRTMSKKRVLNISSRKKRNGMLNVTNSTATGVGASPLNVLPLTVNASTGGWVLWAATGMDLTDQNSGLGTVAEAATRTSTTCYMRGLAEHIRVQTNSPIPWFWRRTVFTVKGNLSFSSYGTSPPTGLTAPVFDGNTGIQRLLLNSNSQSVSQTGNVVAQQGFLFKGQSGVDWTDPILAPIDTTRVTLVYDKTKLLRSGNQNGTIRECKMWHPMNKNIVYDDDESGSTELSSYFSTTSKAGMGDLFVLDQFSSGQGGATSDLLSFSVNSTLYWHER